MGSKNFTLLFVQLPVIVATCFGSMAEDHRQGLLAGTVLSAIILILKGFFLSKSGSNNFTLSFVQLRVILASCLRFNGPVVILQICSVATVHRVIILILRRFFKFYR